MNEAYHIPVLLKECLDGLAIKPDGIYVDVTYGGGGHSTAILEQLGPNGRLVGFDQDDDVKGHLHEDERFIFVNHNFRHLKRFLKLEGIREVDGILADLGVSSHQFDQGERGFSFRFDADLDMRMDKNGDITAKDVLNQAEAEELQHIFGKYGEVRNARTLAQAIVDERMVKPIQTIGEFLNILDPLVRGKRNRYLAQVFQALRIVVNQEMDALEDMLKQSLEVLKPEGRLVVMSYHSLEDRLVKNFMKCGNFEGKQEKDFYGNINRPFKLKGKMIVADQEEQERNPRSRSAKLRIAEKK